MAETLSDWLDKLSGDDRADQSLTDVMFSVGVLLFHVMEADERLTKPEKKKFTAFYSRSFDIGEAQMEDMYTSIAVLGGDRDGHARTIRSHLQRTGQTPHEIMDMLNQMIIVDGIDHREYPVFEEIRAIMLDEGVASDW